MEVKTIVSGTGGPMLLVTGIYTPNETIGDDRLKSLFQILKQRLSRMEDCNPIFSVPSTQRKSSEVSIVEGKIVLTLQYQHLFHHPEGERFAIRDANAILMHLAEYVSEFEA